MGQQRVAAATGVEEDHRLVAAQAHGIAETVAGLVVEPCRVDLVPLGGAHPALLREHHGDRLAGRQLTLVHGFGGGAFDDGRAAVVSELLGVGFQLLAHQGLEPAPGAEDLLQLVPLGGERLLLGADLHLLQPRQLPQLGVQHVVGLHLGEIETLHEHRPGLVLGADDADHLVDVEVGDEQPFQKVQAVQHLVQPVLQAPAHGGGAELQPLLQDLAQVLDPGTAVETDEVQVDPVAPFQVGGGEEMGHEAFQVHPVGTGNDHQAGGILVVRLVTQVLDPGQLPGAHLGGDLLQDTRSGNLVGQGGDHHVALLLLPAGAGAHAATAALVDLEQIGGWRDDLGLGGIVGPGNMLVQLLQRGLRRLEEPDAGAGHLAQVVRRNIGGHAHGDAGGAIEQYVGQACRQQAGLLQGAVEIGHPFHGALAQLTEKHPGIGGEARLGVAHGGERLGIVGGAPVALAVDERVAVGELLGHEHHRLVAGGIAVRVELAQHVTHGTRRLLVLAGRRQPQLGHGIDDAPLHRLEAVADVRQGPVENDVHGIIQVGLLGELRQSDAFDAFGGVVFCGGHVAQAPGALTSSCSGAALPSWNGCRCTSGRTGPGVPDCDRTGAQVPVDPPPPAPSRRSPR